MRRLPVACAVRAERAWIAERASTVYSYTCRRAAAPGGAGGARGRRAVDRERAERGRAEGDLRESATSRGPRARGSAEHTSAHGARRRTRATTARTADARSLVESRAL
jgi:hypothetical protein